LSLAQPVVAIIGTRNPDHQQERKARFLSYELSHNHNCTISTGAAYGIDEAAMKGALAEKLNVYLPWSSYNREIIPDRAKIVVASERLHPHWYASVTQYHPAASRLKPGVRSLHARNYGILEHADLVIAFPNEDGGGGTGQGIRIAQALNIPVMQFNKGAESVLFSCMLSNALLYIGRKKTDAIAA
jgi:predicted Rossmann-fold nucleotide-binding protein